MNKIFKLLIFLMILMLNVTQANALSTLQLDKFIKNTDISQTSTISVSVRNAENGNIVYNSNEKKLLHPASSLKLFTTFAALDTLGYNYEFKTQFYQYKDDLYIKLGADPMLTTAQLTSALNNIKSKNITSFKNLYFDDSIIDKKEFSQGWMWDDDISPYTPKISAYNLDGNIINAFLSPAPDNMFTVSAKSKYPMSILSYIKADSKTDNLEINRYNWINPEVVEIYGTVNKTSSVNIPISNMRRYFIYNIEKALDESKIQITSTAYASKLVPTGSKLLTEIKNPISGVIAPILQNSNNLMAETLYKVAAFEKYNATGSDELAGEMFKEFYNTLGIKTDDIIIKDGCGVSRNNLFSANWMSLALSKIYKSQDFPIFKENMAQTGDGTLSNRLYALRGNAWLKTGSLSNISAISGFVKSLDGRTYAVTILIQNFKENQSEIKHLEDEIIKIIYNK